jgi:hypothetical protein
MIEKLRGRRLKRVSGAEQQRDAGLDVVLEHVAIGPPDANPGDVHWLGLHHHG